MTKALAEAVARRPPRGQGTGEVGAANAQAVTAVSTGVLNLGVTVNGSGFWVTMVCNVDCHIRFGLSSGMGSATASDYLMRAGVAEEWWCEANMDSAYTVIRDSIDGTLFWYRSSR